MFAQWDAWKTKFKTNVVDVGDGLKPGGRVWKSGAVSDGPFVETKEVMGGYSIVQAGSYDEATGVAKECPNHVHPRRQHRDSRNGGLSRRKRRGRSEKPEVRSGVSPRKSARPDDSSSTIFGMSMAGSSGRWRAHSASIDWHRSKTLCRRRFSRRSRRGDCRAFRASPARGCSRLRATGCSTNFAARRPPSAP